jgi:hypothetical protein
MAVGSESNDGLSQTLVESLDGTAWKVVPSPNQGDNANYLDSVSCSSATQCVAVGYDINDFNSDQALILIWNGASWSTMTDPVTNLGETELTGVSCTSTAACMAVGNALNDGTYQTLVESWNGNDWTVDSSPNVGSSGSYLNSVSCLSGDHCTAVGSYVDVANGDFNEGLIETWNGMAWTLAPTTPSIADGSVLLGVSCASDTACIAVGYSNDEGSEPLTEQWNGTTWSVSPIPPTYAIGILFGISCSTSDFCFAVGYSGESGLPEQGAVEEWNGSAWSAVATPPNADTDVQLSDVACPTTSACRLVGYQTDGGANSGLTESWNGSDWLLTATSVARVSSDLLTGVSCVSSSFCMAVGYFTPNGGSAEWLTLMWNGTQWSVVAGPTSLSGPTTLNGVDCLTSTWCVAVGTLADPTTATFDGLIAVWNGRSWARASSPVSTSARDQLDAVSCRSTASCTAVGSSEVGIGPFETLIEMWNGAAWNTVSSPNRKSGNNTLDAVSCMSSAFCDAAGSLVESDSSGSWSISPFPSAGTGFVALGGIACQSSASCVTVGSHGTPEGVNATLIGTWNGTVWSKVKSPNVGKQSNFLQGLSCPTATSCTAVGYYTSPAGVDRTLIESQNGSLWTKTGSPNVSAGSNLLSGVSCVSSAFCVAVGYVSPLNDPKTLIEMTG